MRTLAAQLRTCTPELASLGAPSDVLLQNLYQQVSQGCGDFTEAATCLTRASIAAGINPGPGPDTFSELLNRCTTEENNGGLIFQTISVYEGTTPT